MVNQKEEFSRFPKEFIIKLFNKFPHLDTIYSTVEPKVWWIREEDARQEALDQKDSTIHVYLRSQYIQEDNDKLMSAYYN